MWVVSSLLHRALVGCDARGFSYARIKRRVVVSRVKACATSGRAFLRPLCDGPNWTPRISGIQANDGSYKMSILKAADPEGHACSRFFWEYPATAGLGHFLHTYVCDSNPVIPTFQGEPERVSIPADIDDFTEELWTNLDENNKISLFVRYTDIETGEFKQKIINKHQ